eukprot:snap_masked-scaffold_2-processed-gene-2.8-mRNA-1 protein AED:1.00 eAED:1.00 QI:0/0/0/0/1/1/3/0/73
MFSLKNSKLKLNETILVMFMRIFTSDRESPKIKSKYLSNISYSDKTLGSEFPLILKLISFMGPTLKIILKFIS